MDEDLIDYDSDDLMITDLKPIETSKLDEAEALELKEAVTDINPPTLSEPEPMKESFGVASPFAIDPDKSGSNPQHLDEDLDVLDADGGSDEHIITAAENRRESVHEIDYEDDDFHFEPIHETNSQISTAGNPADTTTSKAQESGTSDDKEPHEPYEIDWEDDGSHDASQASNNHQGSPLDGGNSEQARETASTRANRFTPLPTIWVQYKGQDYPFLSLSTDGFFIDEDILKQPMRDVLNGFRTELSTEIEADDELVFQVDKLGLEFSESSPDDALSDICMQELLSILEMLVQNEDLESDTSGRAMYTFLFTRPNTMKRFLTLREISADGTGLLDAMYSFQPPCDGRVVEIVETVNVSHGGHRPSDDHDDTGADDATYVHKERDDELGDEADYAEEPSAEDEAIRDEGASNYDDEFDTSAGDEGQYHEPEMAGAEGASGSRGPVEPRGQGIVDAGQDDEYVANRISTADDEDLIDFTTDDLDPGSATIGAAHHSDGEHGASLAGGIDAVDEGTFAADEEDGNKRADVDEEAYSDVGEDDVELATNAHRAQLDELIDYSDDKLAAAYSTDQVEKGNDATTDDKTTAYEIDLDQAAEAIDVIEDAVVGASDELDLGGGPSLIEGSDADEEVGGRRRTGGRGPSMSDINLGSTAAVDGLVEAQAETILEAALDVDLDGTWEVEDAQAAATHQSAEGGLETRGTADSSTTATLRDNGDAPLTPEGAVTTTLHANEPVQSYEIDWELGAADDGKEDDGKPLQALKREHPTESDGDDGNGMVKRFEAAMGSAKVKQTSSVVDPEAAPSFTLTWSPSDGHTRLWEQRLHHRPRID